jgi:hypothetical protein
VVWVGGKDITASCKIAHIARQPYYTHRELFD